MDRRSIAVAVALSCLMLAGCFEHTPPPQPDSFAVTRLTDSTALVVNETTGELWFWQDGKGLHFEGAANSKVLHYDINGKPMKIGRFIVQPEGAN